MHLEPSTMRGGASLAHGKPSPWREAENWILAAMVQAAIPRHVSGKTSLCHSDELENEKVQLLAGLFHLTIQLLQS
jgi:hypothetical protein